MPRFADEQVVAQWFALRDTASYTESLDLVQEQIPVVRFQRIKKQKDPRQEGESNKVVLAVLNTQHLTGLITCYPEIVSGTPVFAGTRVPLKNLSHYLKGGHGLAEFFEDFPSVREEQAKGVLALAEDSLLTLLASK
jgi:uncharacterized protein (DUF433 family)